MGDDVALEKRLLSPFLLSCVGTTWARLVKRLKIGGNGKMLHSLRRVGTAKLAGHGVPDAHATALTGHTGGRTDVYFRDYTHTGAFSVKKSKFDGCVRGGVSGRFPPHLDHLGGTSLFKTSLYNASSAS